MILSRLHGLKAPPQDSKECSKHTRRGRHGGLSGRVQMAPAQPHEAAARLSRPRHHTHLELCRLRLLAEGAQPLLVVLLNRLQLAHSRLLLGRLLLRRTLALDLQQGSARGMAQREAQSSASGRRQG